MADQADIDALVQTDARIYLRQSERFHFLDAIASQSGPYNFGRDYDLGDIVGILPEGRSQVEPVKVVEVVMTFEPGSMKCIPTLSAYIEKDPDE